MLGLLYKLFYLIAFIKPNLLICVGQSQDIPTCIACPKVPCILGKSRRRGGVYKLWTIKSEIDPR